MSGPQLAPFTAADYRKMPDDGHRYQLVEGELFMAPAPNTFHQSVQRNLLCLLHTYLLRHSVGTVLGAPCDVYVDDENVFQPDVLFVARQHVDRLRDDGVHGAPDLVIEILSPSTAVLDRRKRGSSPRPAPWNFGRSILRCGKSNASCSPKMSRSPSP